MALKGIKVVELAGLAPAPFCGMVLADFGANVIRVDRTSGGMLVDCLGSGKKSIAVDLKHPEGVSIVRRLCRTSDVLIEPFRRGVMERLGLGPEVLLRDNPRLVYARLTGYGQSGPYSRAAGHDINYLGLSGLLSLFGRRNEKPIFPANLIADFGGGGLSCALGILMALFERHSSGQGQVVDSSMVEGSAYLGSWMFRSQKLPVWGQPRGQNKLDSGAHFYEVYETKDGKFVTVGAVEPQFYENLLRGLGLDIEDCPQFRDHERMKEIFTQKFKEKTQQQWRQIFDEADACVAPVLGLDEAPQHPHNAHRDSFVKDAEGLVAPKPAPVLSRTPGSTQATKPAPEVGEDTWEVLEELGYEDDVIAQLQKEGVIASSHKSKL